MPATMETMTVPAHLPPHRLRALAVLHDELGQLIPLALAELVLGNLTHLYMHGNT